MRKFLLWLAGGVDKHAHTHNSVVRDLQRQVDVLAKDLTKRNEELTDARKVIREVVSERDEFRRSNEDLDCRRLALIDQRNELTVEVASLKDDKQELSERIKACIEQCKEAQKRCRRAELELHSFKEESRLMSENYETIKKERDANASALAGYKEAVVKFFRTLQINIQDHLEARRQLNSIESAFDETLKSARSLAVEIQQDSACCRD